MSPQPDRVGRQTLIITRGDTKIYTFQFTDSRENSIDITGWTIYFTVKKKVTDIDDDAVIKKDITTHVNPIQGQSKVYLSPTDTAITPGNYVYDVQVKTDSGDIHTIMQNGLTITQDVTRRS